MDLNELAREAEGLLVSYASEEADVGYVLRELELLVPAFRAGGAAIETADTLTAWMYLRVVCESGIRLGWIAAGWDDAEAIRRRLVRVSMVDLTQMLRADEVLRSVMAGKGFLSRARRKELTALTSHAAPPPQLEVMATEIGRRGVYAVHRLASAAIHPGLTGGAADFLDVSPDPFRDALGHAFALGCVSSGGILSALAPKVPRPSVAHAVEVLLSLYEEEPPSG